MSKEMVDTIKLLLFVALFLTGTITLRFLSFGGVINVTNLFDSVVAGIVAGLVVVLASKNLFGKRK